MLDRQYLLVVIPEYELWRLGAVPHKAGQVHGDALLHVDVFPTQYFSNRL